MAPGLQAAVKAGHYGDFDGDITAAVLEEAGKFAGDVLAPLNRVGDEHGIKLADNKVTTAPGWPDAYQRWIGGRVERGVGPGSASAARACRLRSTPPAPKSGARRTSPSASARC